MEEMPESLRHLEGAVVLAEKAQDPVCFDPFDAEAIWATVPARRSSSVKLTRELNQGEAEPGRRPSQRGSSSGRWQRGVALPPPSATAPSSTRGTKEVIADNPEDLWDDPVTAAASDFSAFGDLGENEPESGGDAFDFEKMAEESRLLESELHPDNESGNVANGPSTAPRPLSLVGTTIQSGSGDDVNVFEDFDDPANEPPTPPTEATTPESSQESAPAVKNATEDPTASSRLMAMIGVNPDRGNEAEGLSLAALVGAAPAAEAPAPVEAPAAPMEAPTPGAAGLGAWGSEPAESSVMDALNIPLNPWGGSSLLGGPVGPTPAIPGPLQPPQDIGLQARLREAEMEQKAREQLRRQQELEAQKRAQQQQQHDAQQQQGVQSQVELVLMERISTILENSWGRSDLVSILSTLHAEDSRVIPLLNSVDALRALLIRNSARVQVQHDPAFGTEMAVLVTTNAQWQQQQAARVQQEEMRRRIQQQEEQQKQAQAQRQREESAAMARGGVRPDAPWFYSDPQGNIQGPFRPEEMRQWLVAGYFKGDLPVSQDPNGTFLPLSSVFRDLNAAFVFNGEQAQMQQALQQGDNRQAEEEAMRRRLAEQKEQDGREQEARAAAEAARSSAEAAEQERRKRESEEQKAERQRRAASEEEERKAQAERKAREQAEAAVAAEASTAAEAAAAKKSSSNGGNESSAQLKMMLGLSNTGGGGNVNANPPVPATPTPTPVAPRKVVEPKPEQANKRRSAKSAAAPATPAAATEPEPSAPKPPAPPAASPWGSASQPTRKKTMSEIQKEEARAAAIAAMHRESTRSSGSGWANVAASKGGTSGWTSGAVRAAPAAVLTRPQIAQPTPAAGASPRTRAGKNVDDVATVSMQTAPPQPQGGKNSSADAFGAKMSPALEKWCKEQMMKLNGTDDLTLVGFCMTLNDPNEIRQYLTAYLGSTAQVNNFATEFINRKVGVKPAKEEWETTVVSKKKSKKKGK